MKGRQAGARGAEKLEETAKLARAKGAEALAFAGDVADSRFA